MLNQKQIDYQPHSRNKKFYLLLPQLRSGVQPDTYIERFQFPRSRIGFRGAMIALFVCFACLYLLLAMNFFDPIYELFLR